jgi:hypothetical protein
MLYSDLPGVYIIGYIPYVGFATHCRATVRTLFCLKKKKKKKTGRHRFSMLSYKLCKQPDMFCFCKSLVTVPTGRVKILKRKSTYFLSASAKSTRWLFVSIKSFKLTLVAAILGMTMLKRIQSSQCPLLLLPFL